MALDLAGIEAKLKDLETRLPGFAAALSTALKNTEQNAMLNAVLTRINPGVASAEQKTLQMVEHAVDFFSAGATQLLPYIDGILELFASLQPKVAA